MAKVDNYNLEAKLELRRHFLRKYHSACAPHVFDCCQGSGVIWTHLQKEIDVASYWGVDLKPKKGRVKIDSARVLEQPGWPFDIVDVDAYGSPWRHYAAIQKYATRPVTVFLTRGSHSTQPLDKYEKLAIGLRFSREIPRAFYPKIQALDFAIKCCATRVCGGIMVAEAVEAVSDGNARYLGVRLEPVKAAGQELVAPARPKRTKAEKEPSHV